MISRRFTSLALALLMAGLPFLTLAVGSAGASNRDVVNDYLEQVLGTWAADQDIEVLVRFTSAPTTYDYGHLEDAGLVARHTFHVLPAVWAIGRPEAVWRMSTDPRVAWIEWNRPLVYMMENSTTSIRATEVWNSVVEDDSVQYPSIDGSGVTVVVVDSGVDAGHPDLDYKGKTIMNMKSDSNLAWFEVENSDTSSGHGTHVAGTVAGNGDASAGARRGVAPGARLIALSTGEAVAIINALGALEWVYDNSKPGNNPYNIRCATNSWGTSGAPYDPNDSIALVTEALTYDNNVVVTFAAGNDGTNDHDGSTITTNPYSNTPAAVSVAAYTRDGTGVTTFSSRGVATDNATWPDIGAPGLGINSTRARLTLITMEVCFSALQSGNLYQCDPYYMAISGTSMATPHVAGEVALLFQAAPSLRVSDIHADYGSANATPDDLQNWFTNPRTRIHETEAILKLTAHMLPGNGTNSVNGSNFVPVYDGWTGMLGLPRDYAQGYGFTDMRAAISLALTLQKMRSANPKTTVLDAYYQWKGLENAGTPVAYEREFSAKTDTLVTGWTGEYTRYNDQYGKAILVQNTTKLVFVPNGTTSIDLDLTYTRVNVDDLSLGTVSWAIEFPDGTSTQGPLIGGNGHKQETIDASGKDGGVWKVSVLGLGFRLQDRLPPYQFKEMRIPYQIGLRAHVATSADAPTVIEFHDYHAMYAQWRFFEDQNTNQTANGSIVMMRPVFDMSRVQAIYAPKPPSTGGGIGGSWWLALVLVVVIGAGLWVYNEERVRGGKPALQIMVQARRVVEKAKLAPLWDGGKRAVGGVVSPIVGRLRGGGATRAPKPGGGALKGLRAKLHLKRAS